MTWMYNDLDGANENYIIRNLINGFAHATYSSGAARVASGARYLNSTGMTWLGIVGCIVFSTLQVQDLKDVEGDRVRGRSTAPLVLGDWGARWSIAVGVVGWSVACCWFWDVGLVGWGVVGGLGMGVVRGLWGGRGREGDRGTWRVWSVWMMGVYVLPVLARWDDGGWGGELVRRLG